jgi:uncharacterized protein (DUF2267 family)
VRRIRGGLGPDERQVEFDLDRLLDTIEAGGLPRGVKPLPAVAATLGVLSLRLNGGQAVDLVQSLPRRLGAIVAGWLEARGARPARFSREGYLRRLARVLAVTREEAERTALTVFAAVRPRMSPTELADTVGELPNDLRALVDAAAPGGPTRGELRRLFWDELARELPERRPERRRRIAQAVLRPLLEHLGPSERLYLRSVLSPDLDELLPGRVPRRRLAFGELLDRVATATGASDRWIALRMVRAVLGALARALPPEEGDDLARDLPQGLTELWPASPSSRASRRL